ELPVSRPNRKSSAQYPHGRSTLIVQVTDVTDSLSLIRTSWTSKSLLIYACDMGTRSAKLDVFLTNGRKGLFAVAPIAKDEILIDLNGEETLLSPTKRDRKSTRLNSSH